MAKLKTKSYTITDGHILHDGKEYFTGDAIELADDQALLLIVEPELKTSVPDAPPDIEAKPEQGTALFE